MRDLVLAGCLVVLVAAAVAVILAALRRVKSPLQELQSQMERQRDAADRTERGLRDELARGRGEAADQARAQREELSLALKGLTDSLTRQVADLATLQRQQLDSFAQQLHDMTEASQRQHGEFKATVESRLQQMQTDNATRLEEMRRTVDEKLQGTLEKRLGESFKLVSERLEQVHKGLGEMQSLASGVGDLKRLLTNVKTRGTWGEMQLGLLLEQLLTPDQYAQNVATRPGSNERVEFAIRLPGRDPQDESTVWLPIDAKFPKEDYERLRAASEEGDLAAVSEAERSLEARLRQEARTIRDKYLEPPWTTDFGLLFLPTEGLYAEALRRPGLVESLQREYRVTITGPTTLAALLNSLQMGFRTLAIQKRSGEVWAVLGAVKTEFGRFGEVIDRVQKKLQEASHVVEQAATRSRAIERKLRQVQELPSSETPPLLDHLDRADDT